MSQVPFLNSRCHSHSTELERNDEKAGGRKNILGLGEAPKVEPSPQGSENWLCEWGWGGVGREHPNTSLGMAMELRPQELWPACLCVLLS